MQHAKTKVTASTLKRAVCIYLLFMTTLRVCVCLCSTVFVRVCAWAHSRHLRSLWLLDATFRRRCGKSIAAIFRFFRAWPAHSWQLRHTIPFHFISFCFVSYRTVFLAVTTSRSCYVYCYCCCCCCCRPTHNKVITCLGVRDQHWLARACTKFNATPFLVSFVLQSSSSSSLCSRNQANWIKCVWRPLQLFLCLVCLLFI